MIYFRKYSFYLILILLLFFALAPLFHSGFFTMHDDEQVGRLYDLNQALQSGQFPVRIIQDLGFGYGYTLFNYYPPFIYYLAEIFVLLGFGYIAAIKIMIGLGFIFSAFFMYLFSRQYLSKYGALVAAVAYSYAPYHSVDVYVRGALPEFWSFVFVPAIFWSLKKLFDKNTSLYVLITAFMISGLILTHNLVAMMSGMFIAIYFIFLLVQSQKKKIFFFQFLISGILGLLISTSFWLPSFLERDTTMINLLTKELADYKIHFVYLRQLWNSPWGYGGSLYGLEDGLSFQVGKVHIIGSIFALFVAVWLIIKKKSAWSIIVLFAIFLVIATLMTTFYSEPIWNAVTLFSYIQFPWRFLLFSVFASSFLLGAILLLFKAEKIQIILGTVFIIIIIVLNKDYFTPEKYLPNVVDKNYTSADVIRWRTSIMSFEYVPQGVKTKVSTTNTTIIDITKDEIAKSRFSVLKGDLKVVEIEDRPNYKKLQVSGNGGVIRLNTFAYPQWQLFIDNKKVTYNDNNKLKLIELSVPRGNHIIEVKFINTILETVGNSLSATSIIAILLYIMLTSTRKKSQHKIKKADEKHTKQKNN